MPAHTHTQPAQPTTFGHYLIALYDNVMRDVERLNRAYDTVNKSPMGAAAITTSGFPINRERMVELLEFDGLIEKIVYAEVPPKVEYFLTDKGKELYEIISPLENWSNKYYPNLDKIHK